MILIGLGAVLIVAALGWSLNSWIFDQHQQSQGKALLGQTTRRHVLATRTPAICRQAASPASGAAGVLRAPTIGLVAPVEQGLSDPVLAVAIGHDPASVWPGVRGTAVLSAHDVSYFINADHLRVGDLLSYVTPCASYSFKVTGHRVVAAGTTIYNSAQPSVVLVTCWPTDALWFTPDRLVVTAVEVKTKESVAARVAGITMVGHVEQAPVVPASAGLLAQGLTLATNSIPMGSMSITGSPASSWVQSPGPLNVEASAVEAFIGGIKAASKDNVSWWHSVAPSIVPPHALIGAVVSDYRQGLNVAISATRSTAREVQLRTVASLSGGSAPGRYAMTVNEQLIGSNLYIVGWQLQPF